MPAIDRYKFNYKKRVYAELIKEKKLLVPVKVHKELAGARSTPTIACRSPGCYSLRFLFPPPRSSLIGNSWSDDDDDQTPF